MRIVYLTDRLSLKGGADQHLLQVIGGAVSAGFEVVVAFGREEEGVDLPEAVRRVRVRGLGSAVASRARLGSLPGVLAEADVVHVQNVMNPDALALATATGRAVVTVQDHRVFCPGMGKTLPDGSGCTEVMDDEVCTSCLPDPVYRERLLELTAARRAALAGARLVVLSGYMAQELEAAGLPGAEVLPPWVEVSGGEPEAGSGFVLGGRLVVHKGVVQAWQAWCEAGCGQPLLVAGEGPLAGELAGAEPLGWLAPDALRTVLRRARALLFPAFWQEPFGILGVQALAQATPVVAAEAGGTREWSHSGCEVVARGDGRAMEIAIRRLAGDPERAVELGCQGREMVARSYCRERIEPRLLALYLTTARGVR